MNSQWKIELLGGLAVCQDEERSTHFATQKTASLLAYLAFYRHKSHLRETLMELLWPECKPDAGRARLSTLLSYLRHLLEPPGTQAGTVVQADRTTVRLNPEAITTDVTEFERLLKAAARAEEPTKHRELLERAVSLYQGPLLPGFYENWIGSEQARLSELHNEARLALSLTYEQTGEFETALRTIVPVLQTDPYRETTHRIKLRLLASLGRPEAVKESYQALERLFRDELGTCPSTATRELAERLQREPHALNVLRERPTYSSPSAASLSSSEVSAQNLNRVPEIPPATLPLQITRFFGRTQELAQLQGILEETRLVTVTGSGGAGKTRLVIETAGRMAAALHNRVWFVPLADLPEAHLLSYALARIFKVPTHDVVDPLEPLVACLREAPCLLVLDNFEHLLREEVDAAKGDAVGLGKATALVRLLLERTPSLRCLVTSRHALRLAGEQEFPLPPLPLPSISSRPEEVVTCASVALYADRARLARPDFAVTAQNAETVARLCRKLEGIPLAIEMAAAWAKMLPPAKMLERLEERLDALTSRRRDLPARHRSLRATIDWSYELLGAAQQCLLARLSVFRGGWTLEAAEAVCADTAPAKDIQQAETSRETGGPLTAVDPDLIQAWDVLDLLTTLVEKSLVVSEDREGEGRYRLLETVRQYSLERLDERGEVAQLQAQHYAFFIHLAERAWNTLRSHEQIACLEQLEREQDNLHAALAWSRTEAGSTYVGPVMDGEADPVCPCVQTELDLAGRLHLVWERRGSWREGRQHLEAALRRDTLGLPTEARARALLAVGVFTARMGDREAARGYYEECLTIRQQREDAQGLGSVALALGNLARDERDFAEAHRWYTRSLEAARTLGNTRFLATVLSHLGMLAEAQEDQAARQQYHEECLRLHRQVGDLSGIALAQFNLSHVFLHQHHFAAAYAALAESLPLLHRAGERATFYNALASLAEAEMRQGKVATAVRLWGMVQRFSEEAEEDSKVDFQNHLSQARQALGEEAFAAGMAQGRTLNTEQALAEAQAILSP